MWIFTSTGMLSVVAHRTRPDDLLVRAREPGIIEALFPDAKVRVTPNADYRYRAIIRRSDFAAEMVIQFLNIDYDNFKASIPGHRQAYHDACMDVWSRMARLQMEEHITEGYTV